MTVSIHSVFKKAFFAYFCFTFLNCEAQPRPAFVELTEADEPRCSFAKKEEMMLQNAAALEPFFEKLRAQRTQADRKVTVVHIGDSHILGNFLTRVVRERMQEEFGNAGRGLLFPYKLAGSNGPTDYEMTGKGAWRGDDANVVRENVPIGAAGFSLTSNSADAELKLRLKTDSANIARFTKITVFHPNDEASFDFEITDLERPENPKAMPVIDGAFLTSYYLDRATGWVSIKNSKNAPTQKSARIDGISIENELSGIVYHSIGVNGARFWHFENARDFARGIGELAPDLIILSCGTNEAQDSKMSAQVIKKQVGDLVKKLKNECGSPVFLLTTPADSYLRGKGFNPNMAEIRQGIVDFSMENGHAFWDLYDITGGKNSAERWKNAGLMSHDSVHYSRDGYAEQGRMLFWSMMKSYNDFVLMKP